jgi:hypothetical protein
MKAPAMFQIAEGVVGSFGANMLNYPQSLTFWLRGLKEIVDFNTRKVSSDHTLSVFADADDTEEAVQSDGVLNVYGVLCKTVHAAAVVVQLWDKATGAGNVVPGTTATGQQGTVYLPLGAASTAAVGATLWYPYQYFTTGCQVTATLASDFATGPDANSTPVYVFAKTQ